jgi:hypothetical protein
MRKLPLPLPIIHLPHPSSRQWGWIAIACYAASGVIMSIIIAILYHCKK